MVQIKQKEWQEQWELFRDEEMGLFADWIYPATLEDFKDKDVLECGCGGGQHTSFIAPYARHITAVDLNAVDIARERNRAFSNIEFIEADIADMDLKKQFDIVFAVGVIHHTDDPDKTFANLKKHVRRGGKLIVWVYSSEGNFLAKRAVEPVRKLLLAKWDRRRLIYLSRAITFLMYIPVHTIYRLPLKFLPYYEYFGNFRQLSFYRNTLNVFDKLNAPQVEFIDRDRVERWFDKREFSGVAISAYKGVSWRGSGIIR
ncbi:MAG: class I SAM-dependent methyltransferase [Candidatus Omnitrophica bacterium]|nr:class I SAM-dependent methyltransferase [Candidatus Omnitrophota bacterium]